MNAMSAAPTFVQRPPLSRALAPFVERLWHFTGHFEHGLERVLPNGRLQLLVNLDADELRTYHGDALNRVERIGGTALGGAQLRAVAIDTAEQRCVVGVCFHLGGGVPFFREPIEAFTGLYVDLGRLWGRDGTLLRERILERGSATRRLDVLEAALLEHMTRPVGIDPRVRHATTLLEKGLSLGAVTADLGTTSRGLLRLFKHHVGLTPKGFARVARLQRALHAMSAAPPREGWAAFALQQGFHDQAHFIHEIRSLAGMTPTQYRPRSLEDTNHVVVAP